MGFAENIIASMVDENGVCGERGCSERQFDIISRCLNCVGEEDAGGWQGDYKHIPFSIERYEGCVGRWFVKCHIYHHFHDAYVIDSIRPWIDEVPDFAESEHRFEQKQRVDIDLQLIRDYQMVVDSWDGRGYDILHIYTFADKDGNCYIWKSSKWISLAEFDDDGNCVEEVDAYPGDMVSMRATVKGHGEYRGIKQTVLTRCKVNGICKYAA